MVTGSPRHDLEDAVEVAVLHRAGAWPAPARRPASSSARIIWRTGGDALGVEEHVLGAAQADALGAELAGHAAVGGRVGIGADLHAAELVGPGHERGEVADQLGLDVGTSPAMTSPVDPSSVMMSPSLTVAARRCAACARRMSMSRRRSPATQGMAHAARDDGRMAASCRRGRSGCPGPRACRGCPRAGLDAHQDHRLAQFGALLRASSASSTIVPEAAPGDAGRPWPRTFARRLRIERGVQQLVELPGIDAQDRGRFVDQTLGHHVDGHLERRRAVRLPVRVCSM